MIHTFCEREFVSSESDYTKMNGKTTIKHVSGDEKNWITQEKKRIKKNWKKKKQTL